MSHIFSLAGSAVRGWLVLGLSLFTLALAGCSSSTPTDVVQDFYKAVAANKVDAAVAYFSLRDIKESDLTAAKGKMQMVVGNAHSKIENQGGLESVTTTVIEQKDDIVRVKAELKFKNGVTNDEYFTLEKDGGNWKIRLK
jgi:hypothetical protein